MARKRTSCKHCQDTHIRCDGSDPNCQKNPQNAQTPQPETRQEPPPRRLPFFMLPRPFNFSSNESNNPPPQPTPEPPSQPHPQADAGMGPATPNENWQQQHPPQHIPAPISHEGGVQPVGGPQPMGGLETPSQGSSLVPTGSGGTAPYQPPAPAPGPRRLLGSHRFLKSKHSQYAARASAPAAMESNDMEVDQAPPAPAPDMAYRNPQNVTPSPHYSLAASPASVHSILIAQHQQHSPAPVPNHHQHPPSEIRSVEMGQYQPPPDQSHPPAPQPMPEPPPPQQQQQSTLATWLPLPLPLNLAARKKRQQSQNTQARASAPARVGPGQNQGQQQQQQQQHSSHPHLVNSASHGGYWGTAEGVNTWEDQRVGSGQNQTLPQAMMHMSLHARPSQESTHDTSQYAQPVMGPPAEYYTYPPEQQHHRPPNHSPNSLYSSQPDLQSGSRLSLPLYPPQQQQHDVHPYSPHDITAPSPTLSSGRSTNSSESRGFFRPFQDTVSPPRPDPAPYTPPTKQETRVHPYQVGGAAMHARSPARVHRSLMGHWSSEAPQQPPEETPPPPPPKPQPVPSYARSVQPFMRTHVPTPPPTHVPPRFQEMRMYEAQPDGAMYKMPERLPPSRLSYQPTPPTIVETSYGETETPQSDRSGHHNGYVPMVEGPPDGGANTQEHMQMDTSQVPEPAPTRRTPYQAVFGWLGMRSAM